MYVMVDKEKEANLAIDVLFMLDCTWGMDYWLQQAVGMVNVFLDQLEDRLNKDLQGAPPKIQIRAGVVAYRYVPCRLLGIPIWLQPESSDSPVNCR
jgi:hypothetical protein